jgi:hypothetical protein
MNALGYKLRGRHAWPVIRNYRPGFFPWFLDKAEACYMTSALQQAQEVSLRCKDSKSVLKPPKKGFYLVRVSKKGKKGLSWHDEWMQPAPVKYKSLPQISSDEIELRRIKKQASTSSQIWGIDFFYLPAPVKEADRPFFPYAIMIADSDTGFIHNVRISAHDQYRHDLIELLLSSIKNTGSIPLELLVRKEEAKVLLMPVTSHLGIKLSVEKSLGSIDQARRNFARFLKKEFK